MYYEVFALATTLPGWVVLESRIRGCHYHMNKGTRFVLSATRRVGSRCVYIYICFSRSYTRSLPRGRQQASHTQLLILLRLFLQHVQDNEDESEADGKRRERSLLLLSSLGTDALDEVSGMGKVCQHVAKFICGAGIKPLELSIFEDE